MKSYKKKDKKINLDFTLEKYKSLCEAISNSTYTTITFKQYLSQQNLPNKCIVLRHDVDRKIDNALKMADIEYEYGIVSTYYCRKTESVFKPNYFQKIASMGHEIGYHYETLDKAKGNMIEAIRIFEQELNAFREFIDVKTVCMHGNPLTPWINLDIWKRYKLKDYGIIGEPYLSIDYHKVLYLSDTGRTWADRNIRVKDVIRTEDYLANKPLMNANISTTDDLIDLIKNENSAQIFILIHPNRWHGTLIGWAKELLLQNIKNIGKSGIVLYRKKDLK